MSSLAAGTLVIGFLVLVGVPILWLIFRSGVPSPAERAEEVRAFERRLANPDLAGLASRLGFALPEALGRLYADRALVFEQDWRIDLPNPGQRSPGSYVAFFQPADEASLRALGDGRVEWLAFANDGAGDEYLVDLRESDPTVVYLQHDTGRTFDLAVTLSELLTLPRRRVPDE